MDIRRDFKPLRFMPSSAVTYQENLLVWILLGEFSEEYIHADSIAVWHYQEESRSGPWLNCSICISVFTNVVTGCGWPFSFPAPAALWLVDPSETSFILKHYSHVLAGILGDHFAVMCFNFFEESCSSWVAAFGCFDLGITFRHPCRRSTRYTYSPDVFLPSAFSSPRRISPAVSSCPSFAFCSYSSSTDASSASLKFRRWLVCLIRIYSSSPCLWYCPISVVT